MSITPGTRIGPYEITSQLGEGGMGVVFRARDTRLLREVALKLLPDDFADDPDRLSRLQREAQLLASLNHPNIAQIYGLEPIGSSGCIVMELVEGETLADRISRGPLPLDEALVIARQIADALAAAHERGMVHRDLKPANIKLTPGGKVKVLDFGLAKALVDRKPEGNLSSLPTKVSGSMTGVLVGTPAYMSPEQARGRQVDSRADIWAFGCVLFEMLTGKLPFSGETTTDTIARILTGPPDLNLLPPEVPNSVRLLLEATLNKDAEQRLQHIGDMRLFLDSKLFSTGAGNTAAVRQHQRNRALLGIGALVLILVAVLAGLSLRSPASVTAPVMQLEISLPGVLGMVTVSPDGQRVAYLGQPPDENRAIWVRSIGSDAPVKLAGTDNASTALFWSPDNRHLAFVADGKLKKIEVAAGHIQVICDFNGQWRGFTWGRDGTILFGRSSDGVIVRVSENGGEIKPVTSLNPGRQEIFHAVPVFLPDGVHFLYGIASSVPDNAGVFVSSLDSKPSVRVMSPPAQLNAMAYVPPGYLLFSNGPDGVSAQRFDAGRLTLEGQPVMLATGVVGGLFSVSDTGMLLYRKASTVPPNKQLTWFDRSGRQVGRVGAEANYGGLELSPKDDRVAVDITTNNNRDVWVIDIARGVSSRITFDPGQEWSTFWSADSERIVFASTHGGTTHMYEKSSTGVGKDELVFDSDSNEIPVSWTHDGRYIVFSRRKPGGNPIYDTWVLDTSGEKKATPFVESPFDKIHARVSPDGRWIAYSTNDSGMYQIVVQSFPNPNGGKWQITAQGGVEPKWRYDSRELYYLSFDGKLMAVPVKGERTFEAGTPTALFETPLTVNRSQPDRSRRYDVAHDGRFLFAVPVGNVTSPPVAAIVNWSSELNRTPPADQ